MENQRHWAEPSAPDQADEARYRCAVESGLSQAEFEAAETAAEAAAVAAMDAQIAAARQQGASDAQRWDSIYRAAVCAAAQAIAARDWAAKRQAMAVADQAAEGRDLVIGAIFGKRAIPAQYADLERAGATITRAESSAALQVIAADRAAMRQQRPTRGPNGRFPVSEGRRRL